MKTPSITTHRHLQNKDSKWKVMTGGIFKEGAVTEANERWFFVGENEGKCQIRQLFSHMRNKDK